MEDHVPETNFASAMPTTASTREGGDLWSSSMSSTENVSTVHEAGVLEQNCWLQTASLTPFEISGSDQGDSFHDIFNTLQNCQLTDTARVEAEALPEHTIPLSWDMLCNPNQAEASGSVIKRKSNTEMDDRRRCTSAKHSSEREPDDGMCEELEDPRKARVKRTRSAELHNMSERRRRDRLRDKIKTLQQLIPNCNKFDRASVLDDAVEYLKRLKLQVEMLAMGGAGGASTLNPYILPAVSAAGIDNMAMAMGPSYGFNNNMTGLPVMPCRQLPSFPASPTLLAQAASLPYFNGRTQLLSPAAPSAINTGFFPRFNYLTPDKGESSHWNSNPTPSAIDRPVLPAPSQAQGARDSTPRTLDHNAFFGERRH